MYIILTKADLDARIGHPLSMALWLKSRMKHEANPSKSKGIIDKYTLVRHSGFGYASDPQFKQAVETRHLSTKAQFAKVRKQGGIIIEGYLGAENIAYNINYPKRDAQQGIIPAARGTFARTKIDGLHIYIPHLSDVASSDA
jgi:hypothetical protein